MDLVKYTKELEKIVEKYDLKTNVLSLKAENGISDSFKLSKEIQDMQEKDRELKIGIIGRVKAGKSSLINSLVFDGKDILPKAATPMTAALTVLKYSETLEAEVDFFSKKDIEDIEEKYEDYLKEHNKIVDEEFERLLKRKTNASDQEKDELKQKAKKIADRQMKQNQDLSAGYDQYMRIKEYNLELNDLDKFKTISADNIDKLNGKLYDFVGANGKYMPLTKSVTIKMNEESLKNIQIIDTPGINDPVVSRETRTKELLKTCDVVFIISPSGQFLSQEDIGLLHRISKKDGIREIYIVASQVDNQLFGSEKNKNNGILPNILESIRQILSEQQHDILSKVVKEDPDTRSSIDMLINSEVVLSSSVAFTMLKNYDNKSNWDDNTKHVWNNLFDNYKDYFDDNAAISNLSLLSGIQKIKNIVSRVKDKKDEILEQRKSEFISLNYKKLLDYKKAIKDQVNDTINKINSTDIAEIKLQSEKIHKIKSKAIQKVNDVYDDCLSNFEINTKEILFGKVDNFFKKLTNDISESEDSATDSYKVSTSKWYNPFSWGSHETRYIAYTTVKAGFVKNSICKVIEEIENLVEIEYEKNISDFRKNLYSKIISSIRDVSDDDMIDENIISRTIKGILSLVIYPDISYSDNFPNKLNKNGTLLKSEAEEFLDTARDYARSLKNRVRDDIKNSIYNFVKSFKNTQIAKDIFIKYDEEISRLSGEIKDKEQSLERYNNLIKELDNVKE